MPGFNQFGFDGFFGASPPPPPPPPAGGSYFGPGYWGPGYFGPGYWGTTGAATPDAVGTDHDIIEDIIARLVATGAFDEGAVVGYENKGPAAADWSAMARVTPGEILHDDDVDPIEIVARGSYAVAIAIKEEDPRERNRLLSRACNAAMNALNGVSLAGLTLPPMTKIRPKGKPSIDPPYATATLGGTWAMIVEDWGGFDESDANE